jgi:hypothetical protein
MSYTINKTDGTVLTTILDGTTNTDTGLTLIGRNYTGYGTVQNENFVRLLENFADTVPPSQSLSAFTPVAGQLWWDNGKNVLNVYNGADFFPVKGGASGPTAPTPLNVGDTWWNTVNQQLNVWNGTAWYLVGPLQVAGAAKSGVFAEQLADSLGAFHPVLTTYISGKVVGIFSNEALPFTISNAAIIAELGGLTVIEPGFNISATSTIHGTADNSAKVGGISAIQLARVDVKSTFASDVVISGVLGFNNANIFSDGTTLTFTNTNYGAGTAFYNNTTGHGASQTLNIDGTTGLITVFGSPVDTLGIATKGYVDTNLQSTSLAITNTIASTSADVAQLRTDAMSAISANSVQANSNLLSNVALINATIISNIATVTGQIGVINANISGANSAVATLSGQLTTVVNSLQSGINGANVAIITANTSVVGYVNSKIATLQSELDAANVVAYNATTVQGLGIGSQLNSVYQAIAANVAVINTSIGNTNTAITTANTRMKAYVDNANVSLQNWVSAQLGTVTTGLATTGSLTGLAPLASPTFTGTVKAPDPSTNAADQVATIAWVDREITLKTGGIAGAIPNIQVQTGPPSAGNGNDGDIWFQYS